MVVPPITFLILCVNLRWSAAFPSPVTERLSKILIQGNIGGIETSADNNYGQGILLRDSTVIISTIDYGIGFTGDSTRAGTSSSFFILDAPANASAITYKVQFKNAAGSGTITTQTNSSRSAILLMEISG